MECKSFKCPKSPGKRISFIFLFWPNKSWIVFCLTEGSQLEEWKLSSPSTKHTKSWQLMHASEHWESNLFSKGGNFTRHIWWELLLFAEKKGLLRVQLRDKKICCCCNSQFGKTPVGIAQHIHRDIEKPLTSETGASLALHCFMLWKLS